MKTLRKATNAISFAPGTALRALRIGALRELKIHKAVGNSIATWRDGKVVILPPEQIPIEQLEATLKSESKEARP